MKKEEIIKKAIESHNIEYDYSMVKDCKINDNVDIICPKHGLFKPRLGRFLNGSNCPKCVGKIKKSKDEFIKEASTIHNGKYSYDNFVYTNAHTKSYITCPIHGDFEQTPTNHLHGNGCPKCHFGNLSFKTMTIDEFIDKANKKHQFKYNYDKAKYIKSDIKLTITCPIHGDFEQTPKNHLSGRGCPICRLSHLEREIEIFLSENKITCEKQKKFSWLGQQSLDFYLSEYNVAIECQGKQHFRSWRLE